MDKCTVKHIDINDVGNILLCDKLFMYIATHCQQHTVADMDSTNVLTVDMELCGIYIVFSFVINVISCVWFLYM
jgi:purine-nucleoside phosphorylase